MFDIISSFWKLFEAGEAVKDPTKWKSRQITATTLGALIIAAVHLLGAFGYDLPVDEKSADEIAGGVIAVVNIVLTITTNREIGLQSKPQNPS